MGHRPRRRRCGDAESSARWMVRIDRHRRALRPRCRTGHGHRAEADAETTTPKKCSLRLNSSDAVPTNTPNHSEKSLMKGVLAGHSEVRAADGDDRGHDRARSDVREFPRPVERRSLPSKPDSAGTNDGYRTTPHRGGPLAGMSVEHYPGSSAGTWPAAPKRFSNPSSARSSWTRRSGHTSRPRRAAASRQTPRKRAQPDRAPELQATLDAITTHPQ